MTLVGILDVIEEERLYTPRTTVGSGIRNTARSRDVESTLIEARELAPVTVERASQVCNSNDMLAADAVQRLLSDLLDYHTGTRTVHAYILTLLTALSSLTLPESVSSQSLPVPPHDLMFSPLRPCLLSLTRALYGFDRFTICRIGAGCLEEFTRA